MSTILAVDTPLTTLAEAEHALLDLGRAVSLPDETLLCTHMVGGGSPHYAFSLTVLPTSQITPASQFTSTSPAASTSQAAPTGRIAPIQPDSLDAVRAAQNHFRSWPTLLTDTPADPRAAELPAYVAKRSSADAAPTTGLLLAVDQAARRNGGRAVRFPGWGELVGTVTMRAVTASAITRVELLGGGDVAADTQLVTRDFLRPLWRDGDLVLPVLPAGSGLLAPFEVPNPTPCCAEHR